MYPSPVHPEADGGSFHETGWTMVFAAGDDEATTQQSLGLLSELGRIYRRPLYLFLRRDGHSTAYARVPTHA